MAKKLLILGILAGTLSGGFAFAQEASPISTPETVEDAQGFIGDMIDGFPSAFRGAWQEARGIFAGIWNWFKNIFGGIGRSIWSVLGNEVEKRKPEVQQEFQKELQEMKQDVPVVTKSLWERFKDLIY